MTPEENQRAMMALVELSLIVTRSAPNFNVPVVFAYWADKVLVKVEFDAAMEACATFATTAKFFPCGVEFISACNGVVLEDDEIGREVVQKIRSAMRHRDMSVFWDLNGQHPWWWYDRHERAEEYIGPLGWAWVKQEGGWWQVCNGKCDASDYAWTDASKTITAQYKQQRAFGPNPPPIGIPGVPRPSLNESSDVIDVKQIRAAATSHVAAQCFEAVAAEKERADPKKLNGFIEGLKRQAEEESRGTNQSLASPVGMALDLQETAGRGEGQRSGVSGRDTDRPE